MEEIAVLDGVNIPSYYNRGKVIDASAGANYSGGSSWPGDLPLTPSNAGLASADRDLVNYYTKNRVIDASGGANYSGGSSWPGDLPLTPSNAGLADADLSQAAMRIPGYYNAGKQIDASAGANYSGGSSWPGDLPLTPSNAGLAGTYDGMSIYGLDGHYGSTMEAVPGYYDAGKQIDASAGANYSGGSSWPGNLPLTPSNAGLAGLDAVSDKAFTERMSPATAAAFKRKASQQKLGEIARLAMLAKKHGRMDLYMQLKNSVIAIRQLRANIARNMPAVRARAVPAMRMAQLTRGVRSVRRA
jgi:hypothetical protein